MIYDCFIFNDELDLLELRLEELGDMVDFFVLVESNTTFSGQQKPLYFKENIWRFEKFIKKIKHIIVDDMPSISNPWVREIHQRNAMSRGIELGRDNDIILFSDLDEIPRLDNIVSYISNNNIHLLEQRFFYYKYNLLRGVTNRASASLLKNIVVTPHEIRTLNGCPVIKDAGWHFSYLMNEEQIAAKIKAFSHQEFNLAQFTSTERIKERVDAMVDLFDRKSATMKVVPIDDSFPRYLQNNLLKYKDLIYKYRF